MPSPFPGMNPYLEQDDVWQDFHESIIPALREELVKQISPAYIVKVEEHLYIHERSADERRFVGRSNVSISPDAEHRRDVSSTTTLAAPVYGQIPVAVDVERLSYVAVRDRQNRELITVVEVLIPSNKNPGPDRDQYLTKRHQLLASRVHVVELDLLRGGPRLPVENLPRLTTAFWSATRKTGRASACGRSASATTCRRSPFRCAIRTRTHVSN